MTSNLTQDESLADMNEIAAPVLELRNIKKKFKNDKNETIEALKGVSLNLIPGQCVGLVGASGSGKSTLAKIIMKLLPADEGELLFENRHFGDKGQWEQELLYRKNVQMIFQDPFSSLNPVHTVRHHLSRAFLRHQKLTATELETQLKSLLETVGLSPASEFLVKKPFEMSGGQRQRVAIARALAVDPQVIIADEPTSMLDVSIRADILYLLKDLKVEKQLSMLLITHDLTSARFLCDEICVINEGVIVETGATDTVLQAPQHEYTQKLLSASPQLPTFHQA